METHLLTGESTRRSRFSVNFSGLQTKPGTSSPVQIRRRIGIWPSIEGEPRSLIDSRHRRMIGSVSKSRRVHDLPSKTCSFSWTQS